MTQDVTRTLARFAADLTPERMPERVKAHCKHLLLDTLACALAGHQGEETHQIAALAQALGGRGDLSVIGGERLALSGATLLNGYLVTAVTMCDIHRATLTHVTPEVMPPALAIAERDDASGAALLGALAAGCEVTTRVGLGLDYPEFRRRGWHGPGVIGPFGAAAAVGSLRGLDAPALSRAYGLAGSQAAGTFAAWGTPTVKFHQCRGALSGLMAALLAEQGFAATEEFLTASDGGLYHTYTNGGRPEAAVAGLGERWELESIALRLWPSASTIQGFVTALFDLVEKHGVEAHEVRQVRAAMSRTAVDMHGIFPRYKAKFEALLSTHYVAAAVLHDRALTLAQFEPARYDDPQLRRFAAEQVEVRADPALTGVEAVVEVEKTNGTKVSVRCAHPRGSPENPLSTAQVESKFRWYARGLLPEGQIEEVIALVRDLERLASVRRLMALLRRPESEPRRR